MRRYVIAVLAVASIVALVVAGCGSGGNGPPPTGSNQWNTMIWNQDSWGP